MRSNNFAWLCEIKKCNNSNLSLPGAFRMAVRNFRMIMRNQLWNSPLVCSTNAFWSISHSHAKFLHDHAKWKYLIFQLLFFISSISFFWIHLNHLQISSKSWSKCIAFSSSSTLFTLLNFISFLSLNASKITLKYLQNFTKTISISCKGNNVLLVHIRYNYYSKSMEFMGIII